MSNELRDLARVRNAVLLLSSVAWIVLLVDPGSITRLAHCPTVDSGGMPPPGSFRMLLAINPPASLAAGWAVMLVAMMSPVLIAPICHIRLRSFAHRRVRSVVLFVSAYSAVWMVVGCVLFAIELAVKAYTPQSSLPLSIVAIVALVWQLSPGKQRCLNACHSHTELAAFGASADFAALRFGLAHGIWCAASCAALMLLPMLSSRGHLIAMAGVAILIVSERFEAPMVPGWRWRGLGKVTRIALAQARIHLRTPKFTPAESRSG